jgi:site-specific DNA-methyltransferase (adenine-specific)
MIEVIQGNCIDKIKELEDNSIDCVVSSPPYFGLRDYGTAEQFGLEKSYQEYIANTVKVFEEFKPKLKETATIWWNVGDSHAMSSMTGLKAKDLIMIPNRVAIALQDAGWYIRSEIIWHKPNPMPESVRDRPTSAHEKIWLITKNERYYYDIDAIREPCTTLEKNIKGGNAVNNEIKTEWGKYKSDENEKKHRQGMSKTRGTKLVETRPKLPSQKEFVNYLRNKTTLQSLVKNTDIEKTTIEHWFRNDELGFAFPSVKNWNKIKDLIDDSTDQFHNINYGLTYIETHLDEIKNNPIGRNKRNVWTVNTKGYTGAHFATFPPELIEPCIKAGCPESGVVLDPFAGAGTTGLVADRLGKNAILIELNAEYVELIKKRIYGDSPLFNSLKQD